MTERPQELAGSPLDGRRLRYAFGCYPTGVAVVTAGNLCGERVGVTVNSFVSVSLEPPLLQFALHVGSRCLGLFERGNPFCVSVLRPEQRAVSETFARPSSADWTRVNLGPIGTRHFAIADALATFACSVHERVSAGDHAIILGLIDSASWDSEGAALAYFRGRYDTVAGCRPGTESAPELSSSLHALGWG
jgi:flavin reductase (DIM6/NTAB) family NADH-FMN oxidoreductase RutF